jgi:LuxR family transcriptional regulator, maltose regulon positive regulatory protein
MLNLPDVLPAKFQPPRLNAYIIPRAKLLIRLNNAPERPLTLICAPAGYGKSTAAAQWLQALAQNGLAADNIAHTESSSNHTSSLHTSSLHTMHRAWVALDESDNDLNRFLTNIVGAICAELPQSCVETAALLAAVDQVPLEHLTATFLLDLAKLETPRLYLVLDDYHVVQHADIHRLMAKVVRNVPPQLHLVILSRTEPPISLARLRLHGQIADVRMRDLRFDERETADFLVHTRCGGVAASEVARLVELCEGWAAGIQTAVLSLWDGVSPTSLLRDLVGGQKHIMDYLGEEVLAQQPPSVTDFLLTTSILPRFTASLCDAVLAARGDEDGDENSASDDHAGTSSAATIEYLERENLFLISLDDQRMWYRYHHLFQGILRDRLLTTRSAAHVKRLHRAASTWFEAHGLLEDAFEHALAVGSDMAATFIEDHAQQVLNDQDIRCLHRWLQRLPEALLNDRPRLVVLQATLLYNSGRFGAVMPLVERAEHLLEVQADLLPSDTVAELVAAIAGMRSERYFRVANKPELAIAEAEKALQLYATLPGQFDWHKATAVTWRALSKILLGRGREATQDLMAELERLTAQHSSYSLHIWLAVCVVHLANLDMPQVAQTATMLHNAAAGVNREISLGWAHLMLGIAAYERDQLDEAASNFRAAVALRYRAHSNSVLGSMYGLALISAAQMETDEAEAMITTAHQFVQETSGEAMPLALGSIRMRAKLNQGLPLLPQDVIMRPALTFDQRLITAVEVPQLTYVRWLLSKGTPASLEEADELLSALLEEVLQLQIMRHAIPALAMQALLYAARGATGAAHAALEQALGFACIRDLRRVFIDLGKPMQQLLAAHLAHSEYQGYIETLLSRFPESNAPESTTPEPTTIAQPIHATQRATSLIEPLTDREVEVLRLLAERNSYQEIAMHLVISPKTVKKHVSNIYGKLGVARRREAIDIAHQLMLLS